MRYSWRAAEAPRPQHERYEITRDGGTIAVLDVHGRVPNPSLVLGALCDAFAGTAAAKPETPLGSQPVEERMSTGPQQQKIHIDLAELGHRDRSQRLTLITGLIGRVVTSTKDLTLGEASYVIEWAAAARRKQQGRVA